MSQYLRRLAERERLGVTNAPETFDGGELDKGLASSVQTLKSTGQAALGAITGNDSFYTDADITEREGAKYQGNTQNFSDIDSLSSAGDWLKFQTGSALGSLAQMAVGGGLGGAAVKGVAKEVGAKALAEAGAKGLAEREAAQLAAQAAGRVTTSGVAGGMASTTYPQLFGENIQAMRHDREGEGLQDGDVGTAAVAAVFQTALDVAPVMSAFKKLGIGDAARAGITEIAKPKLAQIGSTLGKSALHEGATEAAQEAIKLAALEWVNEKKDHFTPKEFTQIMDSFAAGAVGGGVMGIAPATAQALRSQSTWVDPENPLLKNWNAYKDKRKKEAEAALNNGDMDSAERIIQELEANKAQLKAFESEGELASNPSKPTVPTIDDFNPSEPVSPVVKVVHLGLDTDAGLKEEDAPQEQGIKLADLAQSPRQQGIKLPSPDAGLYQEQEQGFNPRLAQRLYQSQQFQIEQPSESQSTILPPIKLANPEPTPSESIDTRALERSSPVQPDHLEREPILPTSQNAPESTISPESIAKANPISAVQESPLNANQENQGGLSDYQAIFEALPQSSEALAALDHPVVSRAKPYFDAGLIKSPQDIQNFEDYGYPDLEQQPYGVMDWKTGELAPPDAPKPKLAEQLIREQQPFKSEALTASVAESASVAEPVPNSSRIEPPAVSEPVSTQLLVDAAETAPVNPAPTADFVPTHELPDGTPVVAVPDEANVWRTQQGEELIDPNATPLSPDLVKHHKAVNKYQQDMQRIETAAQSAALSPMNDLPEPTQAQKEAGNYKKGMVHLHGLPIAIENPKDSERRGVDEQGKPWVSKMAAHYGYVRGSKGFDGDPVDVFMGDDAANPELPVFVVDQVKPDGSFDEHKVMMGYPTLEEAKQGYLSNYDEGWQGLGGISPMSLGEFKDWLANGDTTKPILPSGGYPISEQALQTIAGEFKQGKKLVLVTGTRATVETLKREGDIVVGTDWSKQLKSKVKGKRFIFTTDKFLALAKSQNSLKQLVEAGNELIVITQQTPSELVGLKVFQGLC